MQNTVISTENEWGGKESEECGMVRGSKDSPEKQDPGMGLLRGKKKQCNCHRILKNKGNKVKNLNQRESGISTTPSLAPWY